MPCRFGWSPKPGNQAICGNCGGRKADHETKPQTSSPARGGSSASSTSASSEPLWVKRRREKEEEAKKKEQAEKDAKDARAKEVKPVAGRYGSSAAKTEPKKEPKKEPKSEPKKEPTKTSPVKSSYGQKTAEKKEETRGEVKRTEPKKEEPKRAEKKVEKKEDRASLHSSHKPQAKPQVGGTLKDRLAALGGGINMQGLLPGRAPPPKDTAPPPETGAGKLGGNISRPARPGRQAPCRKCKGHVAEIEKLKRKIALMEQCLDAEQLQWVENELDVPTSDEPVAAVDADPIGDDEENEDDE